MSVVVVYIWIQVLSPVDDIYRSQYYFSCIMMGFSCVFELTAEAPFFVAQVFCFVKLKVILDTLHIITRSIFFVCLILYDRELAIPAFGIAQFISALTMVAGIYGFFIVYIKRLHAYRDFLKRTDDHDKAVEKFGPYYENMEDFPFNSVVEMVPCVLQNNDVSFNRELQTLILSFVKQGILKQVLTEGEKYVMTVSPVLSFSQQATYDVVNNMGSLAARFVFRPIEDSCYFYYTQTIARDVPLKDQPQQKVTEAANVLTQVCRTVTSIGLLGLVFGQSYAGTVLFLYGGADFVAGGLPEQLLRWHCVAIVLLAINGVTEGYIFATKTSQQIDAYNYYMAIFSITFLMLSYILTNLFGPVGFIFANIFNMSLRICCSVNYIHNQYKPTSLSPLQGLVPGKLFPITLLVTGIVCKVSEYRLLPRSLLYHIMVGMVCVALALLAWAKENQELVLFGLKKFRKSETKANEKLDNDEDKKVK